MAMRRNISAHVWVTDLVEVLKGAAEVLKGAASLVVCTRKKFFGWGLRVFVSDVISGGLFG